MVELTAARCPQCGADLQLPEDLKKAHCLYCGAEILIEQRVSGGTDNTRQIQNLLTLCLEAESRKDYPEALEYIESAMLIDAQDANILQIRQRISIEYSDELAPQLASQKKLCAMGFQMKLSSLRAGIIPYGEDEMTNREEEKLKEMNKVAKKIFTIAGVCISCGGLKACSICEGSGKCWTCMGTGRDMFGKCSACEGSGKCGYCRGSKKCVACGGDGEYRKL